MAEILNYLENSALVANIISFVVLGFAGVWYAQLLEVLENLQKIEKHWKNKQV